LLTHRKTDRQTDRQTNKQTNKVWQKHYLLGGGNNYLARANSVTSVLLLTGDVYDDNQDQAYDIFYFVFVYFPQRSID